MLTSIRHETVLKFNCSDDFRFCHKFIPKIRPSWSSVEPEPTHHRENRARHTPESPLRGRPMDNYPPLLSESKWRPHEKYNTERREARPYMTVKAGAFHQELSSYYELCNGSAFDDTGLAPSNANGASIAMMFSNRKLQSSVNRTSNCI